MKRHNITVFTPVIPVAIGLLAASAVPWLWFNVYIAAAVGLAAVLSAALALIAMRQAKRYRDRFLSEINRSIESADSEVLSTLLVPVLITGRSGEMLWYNESFRAAVLGGTDKFGETVDFLFGDAVKKRFAEQKRSDVEYAGRLFTVYQSRFTLDDTVQYVYYFVDETNLKRTAFEYSHSRPAVLLVAIDNMEDVGKNQRESERANFTAHIEREIEAYASEASGICLRVGHDRHMIICEERSLNQMIERKFDILEHVRAIKKGKLSGATLSIGVGHGEPSFAACQQSAAQALDMALGRGGDQAAVRTRSEYVFFGGVSQASRARTSVRARVIANSIRELICTSSNVVVMGHRYSDLDSFGSAIAICRIAEQYGKQPHIVADANRTMAGPLMERMRADSPGVVISPEQALAYMSPETLLVVTDTHRPDFLESRAVYETARNIVVIDHHRKTVDYIDNAVIFYHEPTASSASELVTELLNYLKVDIDKFAAEALLSGIVLDTRNYVLRTGVRTFESSAYLRGCGADPVEVKRLFSISMSAYTARAEIVAAAKIYRECAISLTESDDTDTRIAAAGAADEMLAIKEVKASFVVFRSGGEINISARSFGEINVQLIMELLGGGGHASMSAAQLDCGMDEAMERLKQAIDKNFDN